MDFARLSYDIWLLNGSLVTSLCQSPVCFSHSGGIHLPEATIGSFYLLQHNLSELQSLQRIISQFLLTLAQGSTTGLNLPFQINFPCFVFSVLHIPTNWSTLLLTKAPFSVFLPLCSLLLSPITSFFLAFRSSMPNIIHHSRPRSNVFSLIKFFPLSSHWKLRSSPDIGRNVQP